MTKRNAVKKPKSSAPAAISTNHNLQNHNLQNQPTTPSNLNSNPDSNSNILQNSDHEIQPTTPSNLNSNPDSNSNPNSNPSMNNANETVPNHVMPLFETPRIDDDDSFVTGSDKRTTPASFSKHPKESAAKRKESPILGEVSSFFLLCT